MALSTNQQVITHQRSIFWISLLCVVTLIGFLYFNTLIGLIKSWDESPEYSHGYLIVFLSLFLLWHKHSELAQLGIRGSWLAIPILVIALLLYMLGEFYSFRAPVRYSLILVLIALSLSLVNWRGLRLLAPAIVILIFMIPMPGGLHASLSSQLQTVSSELGVAVIRLLGISVFLDGNVIDLGVYKLQVVEACSGLRYLFPLMSFGFVCAYFFTASLWLRVLVFLSTIPIAVFMNGVRIGITGFLVEHYGIEIAEGFMHDFEGWLVFMACIAILIAEIWLIIKLARLGKFRDIFGIEFANKPKEYRSVLIDQLPKPYLVTICLVLGTLILVTFAPKREINIPQRLEFTGFPMEIGNWNGKRNKIEQIYLDVLQPTDYIIADYKSNDATRINLYIAYYESSLKGEFLHSPKGCIPSGGWTVKESTTLALEAGEMSGIPIGVRRVQIHKGEYKQLVYYWIQQGGRPLLDKGLVMSWYRFWDGVTKGRTDNALIRLVTPVQANENWDDADQRLKGFVRVINDDLSKFLPTMDNNYI